MNTTYQSIAIVDAAATDTIVWQVDVSAPGWVESNVRGVGFQCRRR
jgi:hypothetical protein